MHGGEGRDWDTIPSKALQQYFAANQRESSEGLSPCVPLFFGPTHDNAPGVYRYYIHPQVLVRRGVTGLDRSAPAQVWSIRNCGLPQRKYLDQGHEKPHRRAPQGRPCLVLLVLFLYGVRTYAQSDSGAHAHRDVLSRFYWGQL